MTVSECGVPASPPTTSVRLFVEFRTGAAIPGSDGTVDIYTGFAAVNRGNGQANILFSLRNLDGQVISQGTGSLAKGGHISKYIHQLADIASGFSIAPSFSTESGYGSLELSSDQPLSVVALRLTINQRGETLLTTTPVADLTQPQTSLEWASSGISRSSWISCSTTCRRTSRGCWIFRATLRLRL